jgi:ABC-type glucose/galactose transport system permease subunit
MIPGSPEETQAFADALDEWNGIRNNTGGLCFGEYGDQVEGCSTGGVDFDGELIRICGIICCVEIGTCCPPDCYCGFDGNVVLCLPNPLP